MRWALAMGLAVGLGACNTTTQRALIAGAPGLTLPPGPKPAVSATPQEARARGVTLRALGQEPTWQIEVGPNNRTVMRVQGDERFWVIDTPVMFRAADGQRLEGVALAWSDATGTEPALSPSADGQGGVLRPHRQRVQLTVRAQACTDTMSGQAFEATAVLQLGDRRLNGCASLLR
jgi:uncharacterized membrane protein